MGAFHREKQGASIVGPEVVVAWIERVDVGTGEIVQTSGRYANRGRWKCAGRAGRRSWLADATDPTAKSQPKRKPPRARMTQALPLVGQRLAGRQLTVSLSKSAATNSRGSNGRRSAIFSPTPTQVTGILSSSQIPMITPPLAVPSSLVSAMFVTPTTS